MEKKTVNTPFDGNADATHYCIRSYTRTELARQYMPDVEESTARKKFNKWLRDDPDLSRELRELGADIHSRCFTPRQVQAIYNRLGLPATLMPYW